MYKVVFDGSREKADHKSVYANTDVYKRQGYLSSVWPRYEDHHTGMRDRLHRYSLYHRYAPAGRLHRDRLGRTCIRNSMDGGWINAGVYTLYRDNYKKAG